MAVYDDEDIFLAKWLYQSFTMVSMQDLGPGYRIPPTANKVIETLTPALAKVIAQAEQTAANVWEVPSPWHAALYLGSLQHHLAQADRRVLFRGQRNSDWMIRPSIARAANRHKEQSRGRLFCEILSSLSFNNLQILHPVTKSNLDLRISAESYWAAAQHYGISTNLIDFTTDAAVGVFFACQKSEDTESEDQTASVHVLLLDIALENGCEVILPPPFVRRLYTQRGVFVRSDDTLDSARLNIMEVRFPVNHAFRPFNVIRSDVGIVDVLSDSAQLHQVLDLVDSELMKAPTGELQDKTREVSTRVKSSFSSIYDSPFAMWGEYVDFFEDQLYWIAYAVDDSSEKLRLDILKPIVRSNRNLAASVAQMYRWLVAMHPEGPEYTEEKRAYLLQLAATLDRCLNGHA